jgi:molecular chaperone Hsp33
MIYKDNLQRFLFENISVRGEFIRLNKSYQTIIDQHQYPPAISELLGEALAVVNLLTAIIKFKGRLTVQFQGKGDLKLLLAQCNHEFQFRGVAQWKGNPSHEDLIVSWQGHSLAQSIEGYFRDSEQLPTRIWLAVNKTDAVGFLLQIMPKNDSTEIDNTDWEHVVHLADTLTSKELLEHDNPTLLHRLYHQEEIRVFEPVPVEFRCTCSVERSENAMLLLGYDEVQEELLNKQQIVVTCEFCNKEYAFGRADIERIFNKGGNSTSQVH